MADSIPADQVMLLRLIDAKFETMTAKIDGLQTSLTIMSDQFDRFDDRFQDHEKRIAEIEGVMIARQHQVADFEALKRTVTAAGQRVSDLEKWQTEEQTTSRNAGKWAGALWGAFGSAITAGLLFLASLYFQSQPTVTQTTVTHGGQHKQDAPVH